MAWPKLAYSGSTWFLSTCSLENLWKVQSDAHPATFIVLEMAALHWLALLVETAWALWVQFTDVY